jgi:hypothetical protein
MGFVRQRRTYRLVWSEGEFTGLEVVASSASVAGYRQIAEWATRQYSWPPTTEDLMKLDELHEVFGEMLVSWNLERPKLDEHGHEIVDADGSRVVEPVPPTVDGLRQQDPEFTLAVIVAWMDAVAGVPAPLGGPSSSGERSLEESLPMDVLLPDHQ